ncbi:hypothetical protein L1987_38082 [Smallanthus sonchifolius]|uniref:Uncharacterized protein n=1 Tax=Smallanthus sonchifolius TaxID=185202 RepID=A0ACB9HHP5_9ASTR|nr:hypothetical protein L1987_38082 [Smallanthus sonchifolius]
MTSGISDEATGMPWRIPRSKRMMLLYEFRDTIEQGFKLCDLSAPPKLQLLSASVSSRPSAGISSVGSDQPSLLLSVPGQPPTFMFMYLLRSKALSEAIYNGNRHPQMTCGSDA